MEMKLAAVERITTDSSQTISIDVASDQTISPAYRYVKWISTFYLA
jgi:hypothetical protein